MSGSSLYDIQSAVYTTLTEDSTLMDKVSGIFDFTPDNQAFPYVTIGESIVGPYSTFSSFGQEVTMTLHVWSRYLGYGELESITDDIVRLLGNQFIILEDWSDVGCWFDSTTTLVEPDGITRHAILQFLFRVLQNE